MKETNGFRKVIILNIRKSPPDISSFMTKKMIQLINRKFYFNKDKVEHLLHHDVLV
jgi:hypothetical protein